MQMGVAYRPSAAVTVLEQTSSPLPAAQIFADYVAGGEGRGRAPATASLYVADAGRQPDPSSSPPVSSGDVLVFTGSCITCFRPYL